MFTRRKIFFPINLNEARGSDSLSRVRDSNRLYGTYIIVFGAGSFLSRV